MCTVPWSHMTMKWMTRLLLPGCCAPLLHVEASTQVTIISVDGPPSRGAQIFALERCHGSVDGSVMEEEAWVRLVTPSQCHKSYVLCIVWLNFNLRCCWFW